ncbi:Protein NRT1/PTR FAMILY 4.3 [Abeliophyllum distichum]|uniref:Protein NRT1/PTR FAMILY 4.3 n=1 Tax=Abeliophyllum distichum TaxID=126358 RepID=A0ABD1RRM5_9LAMI
MRPAAFVLGLQGFEIMAIAAVGNNLITYVINEMHFSLSKSANIVTNFIGTVFILSLFGGYLSDSYLGCFWTMLTFGFLELSGFILLSVQDHLSQLKPLKCNMVTNGENCEEAKGFKSLIFFVAHYLVALGSGCVKPNMIAHGADQFNQTDPNHSNKLSKYFNAAYFAFSIGELVALTLLVWVQTHSGMDIGNKPPQGSILTPIAQVFVAAILKREHICPFDPRMLHGSQSKDPNSDNDGNLQLTERFRFLNRACIKLEDGNNKRESPWSLYTVNQVEQRIGFGLFVATFSMISAAIMENKRRNAAVNSNVTLSVFWITPQFLIFGMSEMFRAVGLIEFFYKQSLRGMQSFLTAITYCSYSFCFYLSSVLVYLVNKITSHSSGGGWLSENNPNKDIRPLVLVLQLSVLGKLVLSQQISIGLTTN